MFSFLVGYLFIHLAICTEYPLYAIITGYCDGQKVSYTQQDIDIIANNFTRGQLKVNSSAAQLFHQSNPAFQIEKYTQTWLVENATFGEGNKEIIAIYPFGTLSSSLNANNNDSMIHIQLDSAFDALPISPSTAKGDYSESCQQYISFIQIDDEYMKVLSIQNDTTLIVERAFIGINNGKSSLIASHAVGSMIFAPVYSAFSPLMPSCTSNIRYAINAESQYAVDILVNATIESVNAGYNGSWFDCFSSDVFEPYTLNGDKLNIDRIWDKDKSDYFDCTSYRMVEQNRLSAVWNGLKHRGYDIDKIIITANDMYPYSYFECGTRELLIKDSINGFEYPLDGYSIESYAFTETGSCQNSSVVLYTNVKNWMQNVQELMNASQSNLNAMPMIGDAGCHSYALEKLNDSYHAQLENFGYASFLLAVESKNGNSRFGIPAMRIDTETGTRYAHVSEAFFWNIGNPIESHSYLDMDKYIVPGHFSFMRHFENGVVLINPYYNQTDEGINLNQTYFDPANDNTKMKDNIKLDPYSAMILLKSPYTGSTRAKL